MLFKVVIEGTHKRRGTRVKMAFVSSGDTEERAYQNVIDGYDLSGLENLCSVSQQVVGGDILEVVRVSEVVL